MSIEIQPGNTDNKPLIISQIHQVSIDRSPKDIRNYVDAEQSAESMYNPNRSALYDIYARIIKDGTLTGVWENKRVVKICNKKIIYKSGNDELPAFDSLTNSSSFNAFVNLIMQQKAWGLSGAEFIPGKEFNFVEIPRKHINPQVHKITKYQYGNEGVSYIGLSNVMVLGSQSDLGFLIKAAPLVLYKQGNWGDWADFIEKYGQPFQEFTYSIYDPLQKQEAFNLAANAGSSLAIVRPKEIDFDVKDGKQTNGDGKLQDTFKAALNEEIALIVVGNTLTSTSAGGGAYALGEIHQSDQNDIIERDLTDVLAVLNSPQFLGIVKSYGYPVTEGGRFEFEQAPNMKDLIENMNIDKFLIENVNLPLDDDYFYERYNRPKPDNYNQIKEAAAANKEDKKTDNTETTPVTPPKKTAQKKPKKETEPDNHNEGLVYRIRTAIADFFDHGHNG